MLQQMMETINGGNALRAVVPTQDEKLMVVSTDGQVSQAPSSRPAPSHVNEPPPAHRTQIA